MDVIGHLHSLKTVPKQKLSLRPVRPNHPPQCLSKRDLQQPIDLAGEVQNQYQLSPELSKPVSTDPATNPKDTYATCSNQALTTIFLMARD
jgi:hypothetical protein